MVGSMTDLVTRLQQATEGSREEHIRLFTEVEIYLGDDCPEDFSRHLEQARRSGSDKRALGYLFLAALTLVPEGRWWVVNSGVQSQSARAQIDAGKPWETFEGHGATPALALCIAALRARG